ncbi:hypothetical protein PENTCL1PPCAC_21253, partial [Pristionchus entomophagus]
LLSDDEPEVQFLSLLNREEELEKTSKMRLTISIWNDNGNLVSGFAIIGCPLSSWCQFGMDGCHFRFLQIIDKKYSLRDGSFHIRIVLHFWTHRTTIQFFGIRFYLSVR